VIIRYTVGNFASIKEKQELSFVASGLRDDTSALLSTSVAPSKALLPVALIYGPNASGKTSFVRSLKRFTREIKDSHPRRRADEKVRRNYFRLDANYKNQPTMFDLEFECNNTRYQYGYEIFQGRFSSEWLYSYPNEKLTKLFSREGDDFKFSRVLHGNNKTISQLTRPNSLFLSAAVQNSHEQLTEVANFIADNLYYMSSSSSAVDIHAMFQGGEVDRRIISILSETRAGVCSARKRSQKMPEEAAKFMAGLQDLFADLAQEDGEDVRKRFKQTMARETEFVELGHRNVGGEIDYFPLDIESAGTIRLLALLNNAFKAIDSGGMLVIDEIDASLHTRMCELLITLFQNPKLNTKKAQLLATTHDTNLMRSPSLRRDQLWFAEKARVGATEIYPLTDISTRKGDNIERGYLQGRYGAVPFAGGLDLDSIGGP